MSKKEVKNLKKIISELKSCLRWYVENDDVQEGGHWEESNAFWLEGKRKAQALLESLESEEEME
jgi:hypothetical protein